MISCPGDVVHERKLLKECVEQINMERSDDVWVELQYWVTDTSSDAGMQAQDSINEQMVNDCDGLIAIFNARLGTPVHDYKCGTDEEIALTLKAKKHVSLLFNTKPVIDLSNSSSIEQITKLQEYKNEQSKKAYYREFSDENSFMVLARREILLWLRNITKEERITSNIKTSSQDNNIIVNTKEREEDSKPLVETTVDEDANPPVVEEISSPIDEEAGMLDCVIYITDSADILNEEINKFSVGSNQLSEKVTIFANKISHAKKQENGNASVLLLCKELAKDTDNVVAENSQILDTIEHKWNEMYRYLLLCNKMKLSDEDKTILEDSVYSLRVCFEELVPQIDSLIDTFYSTPNYQKDLKSSINRLSGIYKRFKAFTIKAIENCTEIEESLNNVRI
jgi:hypothetical protein